MKLQEDILRMKSMMGLVNEEDSNYTFGPYCSGAFKNDSHVKLCYSIENILKPTGKKGQKNLKNFVNNVMVTFNKLKDVSEVEWSNFKESHSEFFESRMDEIDEFLNLLDQNICPTLYMDILKKKQEYSVHGIKGLLWTAPEDVEDSKKGEKLYSHMNRLNTNYSALAIILTRYAVENNLEDVDVSEIIDGFRLNGDEFMSNMIFNQLDKKIENTRKSVLYTISRTRKAGNVVENKLKKYLDGKVDFIGTQDDFSFIDMLGIDLIAKFPKIGDYYVPVQVKSFVSNVTRQLTKYCSDSMCNGIMIYPKNNEFYYLTCDGSTGLIDKLF